MGGSLSVRSRIFSSFCLFVHPTHISSLRLPSPPTVLLTPSVLLSLGFWKETTSSSQMEAAVTARGGDWSLQTQSPGENPAGLFTLSSSDMCFYRGTAEIIQTIRCLRTVFNVRLRFIDHIDAIVKKSWQCLDCLYTLSQGLFSSSHPQQNGFLQLSGNCNH